MAVLAVGGCAGHDGAAPSASTPAEPSPSDASVAAPSVAAWHRWGLTPMRVAPKPPADKPIALSATGEVPVFAQVSTSQRVVFITIDDGMEKDPAFVGMMRDLKTPITMFLMNDAIKSDYAYFKPLQALGNHIQNHTLHHPAMTHLSLARQENEVCGDQKALTEHYGTAPLLFRPPYGVYDKNTEIAVRECGPRAIVWWRETVRITSLQYQRPDKKLHAGDIILVHFRGPEQLQGATMTQMFANVLRQIEKQGFAVARLEDYIRAPSR
ncbi:polysaccharide deacetylase family protein [Streptomyces mobaraensis NBRC 13819 = DSM 40847]|nr:polysaccharide deacetylase family protein [Streptomyces mobaraensis]QTT73122.1 polysaccharide deacetylase family protein [Streptomyces mobaraensis NBRC 13819 = DSM 40847]